MKKYYAGIGSRETPDNIFKLMTEIASILEDKDYILRSGAATGADTAFEVGVKDYRNMVLYLPKEPFNDHTQYTPGCIYITDRSHPVDYQKGYESIIIHPQGFGLKLGPRNMMIRNYFQIFGHEGAERSSFVICWTPDGANGTTILTSRETGGSGQAIRHAAAHNIPVYNLNSDYGEMNAQSIVDMILKNLDEGINPHIRIQRKTTSLF